MSKKCVAFSKSKLGIETADNRKSFYAGWDAAVLTEREACAKVCEDDMGWLDNGGGELCAAAIRARGDK